MTVTLSSLISRVKRHGPLRRRILPVYAAVLTMVVVGCGGSSGAVATAVPLHFWISNQSLGTDIPEVPLSIDFDGEVIFNQPMKVGAQLT